MRLLKFDGALLPQGWTDNVIIGIEGECISFVGQDADGEIETISGAALPGLVNAHSHAFQRVFAGLTERRSSMNDSFWTWRDTMYRAALALSPESVHAIAAQAYSEMLAAGYTHVVEFHYVHHRADGSRYSPLTTMSDAIVAAAHDTGIGLTLAPVLYQVSGFGMKRAKDEQRRFLSSTEQLFKMIESLRQSAPKIDLALALHSLRAVPLASLKAALELAQTILPNAPIHIHIAEQQSEVDECLAFCGRRPVEFLLDEIAINEQWTLIHATHVTPNEINRLAATGATVAICPSTEGNLGDGLFPFRSFLEAGGQFAVGSDSQVTIDPFEELRWLDYGQRLTSQQRGVSASPGQPHPGARLFEGAIAGGRLAAGLGRSGLQVGARADLIVVATDHPSIAVATGGSILDTLVFHSGARHAIQRTMASGKWVATGGRHRDAEAITRTYRRTAGNISEQLQG